MKSNYDLLVSKINEFIQKFYLNKLLRGSIYTAALMLSGYLCLFLFIYFTYPTVLVKTVLFFAYLGVSLTAIAFWIGKPALHYFRLGDNLSMEEAAVLIGDHFFHVRDKLLNTLQLKALADANPAQNALILAGIDQKIMELRPVPFSSAIRFKDNRKYLKYCLLPLAVIVLIGAVSPAILKEGTSGFIQYNREILPKAPFNFVVMNRSLQYTQGDDVTITLRLTGETLPQDVYIVDGKNTYKLIKADKTTFTHVFPNIQQSKQIFFSAGGFSSAGYLIEVRPRAALTGVSAALHFPAYLNRKTERINNAGDLTVPEGTKVTWNMQTVHAEELEFSLGNKVYRLRPQEDGFSYSATLSETTRYRIFPKNRATVSRDSLSNQILVMKDQYPAISVSGTLDSITQKAMYFVGSVSDDYGLTALHFKAEIRGAGAEKRLISKRLPLKPGQAGQSFTWLWNINDLALKPGERVSYLFEVTDNDGVNGGKKSRTDVRTFENPTAAEVSARIEAGSSALKGQMERAIKLAGELEKESKKLAGELLDKKQLGYEERKQIEALLNKRKELERSIEQMKLENEQNTLQKIENQALKEEMLEKQKQIDELFNQVLDDKTKSLLQKLQDMMDQRSKDQTRRDLSDMQMDNKSLRNELDRILELYKQLEFEQQLEGAIDQLRELGKEQQSLAEETRKNASDPAALKKKQQQLNEAVDKVKKDLAELEKKNEMLERPNSFNAPEEKMESVQKKQEEANRQLDRKARSEAAENQRKAAEEMNEMAKQMEEEKAKSEKEAESVNARDLRQLLENLLKTSFEQEKLMLDLKEMNVSDPRLRAAAQKQRVLKDYMKTVGDSLFSLSKRVPQIEHAVNEEMHKVNQNVDKSLEYLSDRNLFNAGRHQQQAMTAINNLTLMLNEALEQLQQSKSNAKSGRGQKNSMQQLRQMQQQLNENMQKAREQLQKGGGKGSVPKGQMSEEFGRMAQQQQMIREGLQKLNNEGKAKGAGGNMDKLIEEMKKTESDLVNKRLELEAMNRQRDLLVKMLDLEKAEKEQEEDSSRQSKAGRDFPPHYLRTLEKMEQERRPGTQWLDIMPAELNHYYKNSLAEYYKMLNLRP
ncbi:DUF4175 family protein [Pedobacter deserti]|uniref:DUF4175 family protein n=1 Tax=Pedobacter deserti TaxID=2817382 RepID=UPI002108F248|nr:DUF4175 family protein [Pedobacter sp. SYSU D00382]